MSVHQSETTARPEVHGTPKERATTAHSPGTASSVASSVRKVMVAIAPLRHCASVSVCQCVSVSHRSSDIP